jgi:hypothetical protein
MENCPNGRIMYGNSHKKDDIKNYTKHIKWFDGEHSDNEADTWPWLFALAQIWLFCLFLNYLILAFQNNNLIIFLLIFGIRFINPIFVKMDLFIEEEKLKLKFFHTMKHFQAVLNLPDILLFLLIL